MCLSSLAVRRRRRLHSELKRLAWTDALSGLANRRAFDQMLDAEIARAQRYDHPLSLIINLNVGQTLDYLGRTDEALAQFLAAEVPCNTYR